MTPTLVIPCALPGRAQRFCVTSGETLREYPQRNTVIGERTKNFLNLGPDDQIKSMPVHRPTRHLFAREKIEKMRNDS